MVYLSNIFKDTLKFDFCNKTKRQCYIKLKLDTTSRYSPRKILALGRFLHFTHLRKGKDDNTSNHCVHM